MGRSVTVGHDKLLTRLVCCSSLLGTTGKNTLLILLGFFPEKSHPRNRTRTHLLCNGKLTRDCTVRRPFFGAKRTPN